MPEANTPRLAPLLSNADIKRTLRAAFLSKGGEMKCVPAAEANTSHLDWDNPSATIPRLNPLSGHSLVSDALIKQMFRAALRDKVAEAGYSE